MSTRAAPVTVFAAAEDGGRPRSGERLDEQAVRELAGRRGDPVVTSVYLDVDGRRRPAPSDCDTALGHLFREARRQAEARSPEALESVEVDVHAMVTWLAPGVDRSRCRGVARSVTG